MFTILFLLAVGLILLCLIPIFGGMLMILLPVLLVIGLLIGLDVLFFKNLFGKRKKK